MNELPDEFDADLYRSLHSDLAAMEAKQLLDHFRIFGRREGRQGSEVAHRKAFLKLCSTATSVLEIGPFCNPALTGPKVRYFDVLDTEGLRDRAAAIGYPVRKLPHIDYVEPGGDLSVVDRRFEAVFSSHCIEHQPDLIHHLVQVEQLLEENGKYFLLIPDKRYCFDHFIAESTIANVIDANVNRLRTHRLESVIEHRALTTHNDPDRHWRGDHADPGYWENIPSRTRAAIEEFQRAHGSYIDVHAWQFTPESFRSMCKQILELGYTKLQPIRVYDTPFGSNEFAAILSRTPA